MNGAWATMTIFNSRSALLRFLTVTLVLLATSPANAQFGGRFGGGMANSEISLVATYDKDKDGHLNAAERKAVREASAMGGGRAGRNWPPDTFNAPQGPRNALLKPADVKTYTDEPLYDPAVLRTIFLTFENKDWEEELAFFYNTDVEVPATVVVDGKTYRDVGVHFRGMTSFRMVGEGQKRSLNLSFDDMHDKQRLLGYQTLNLLNSAADPTFLRSMLYMQIARDYIAAPQANYARVVINGENWGIYINLQQFNSAFVKEAGGGSGERWKVPGNPRGRGGGLAWLGEDAQQYRRYYEIRSKDLPASWEKLVALTRVLNQTPPARLVDELSPILDIDAVLRFLAVEKVLINNDGYWARGSDYSLYIDAQGRFHVVPHDVNETMRPIENLGWGRFDSDQPPGQGAIDLDLFAGADDPGKPLLNRLMLVPELKLKYLGYVKSITEKWLNWERIGPLAASYQALIAADVKADNRKLGSTEQFTAGVTVDVQESFGGPISAPGMSLKTFVEKRRAYVLGALEMYDRERRSAQAH
jgi:CotH kinase protein